MQGLGVEREESRLSALATQEESPSAELGNSGGRTHEEEDQELRFEHVVVEILLGYSSGGVG